jgi:hypothetical protein
MPQPRRVRTICNEICGPAMPFVQSRVRKHARTHACTHARTHARTHTHTQNSLVLQCRRLSRGRQPSDVELGARRAVGGRSGVGACKCMIVCVCTCETRVSVCTCVRGCHQNLGSSYKTENSVYTTVYNRFSRKHGRFDRRNGQRNRAVTHTPNLSTTFAGIRRRCVRELRRVGQGGVRRFVPKSLSHGADQRARLARQKKPPKPVTLMPGLPW